jgi:iron complex outermembrane receptor protein
VVTGGARQVRKKTQPQLGKGGFEMTTRTKYLVGLGVSLAAMAAAATSSAQTSPSGGPPPTSTPPPQAGGSAVLPDVIVTAQRHSENLEKVPIAVTSFTAQSLGIQQVNNGLDLGRLVPDMFASNNVGQGSANVYYIRGLGQTQSFPTFEPQVGLYVDDIYFARVNANNVSLFGVSQVQVLNGPQGTLFGRNSTGGAILVTMQKPGQTFGGDAELSYGSYNGITGRASVDMPINDQVLTRTSVFGISNNGYTRDVTTQQMLNGTNDYGVREAVTILPKAYSNVEWDLSGDYQNNNAANLLNQPSPGGQYGSGRISYSGLSTHGGALLPYLTGAKAGFGQGADVQTYGFASNIKITYDAGTLNFITGYRGLSQNLAADFPAAGLGPLPTADAVPTGEITLAQMLRSSQFSQELKWTGNFGDRVSYTAGAFYLQETNSNNYGQILGLGPTFAFPLNDQLDKNDTISEAVYAQGDFKITSQLTFTVGGRFTHEIKTVVASPNAPGLGYTTAQIQAAGYSTHLDANEFTPRFVLQYQFDPQLMVFASATNGFQGGGWNGLTGTNPKDFNNFSPETIWSYEAGFRSETPDRRVRLNATAFYEDVDHYQLLSDNPFTQSFDTSNAANMEAYGIEATITWQPIDRLLLSANVSSMRAFYYDQSALVRNQQAACIAGTPASCDSGIVTTTGALATPVYTPPLDISANGSYTFEFSDVSVTPTVAVQFVAREWFDTANTPGTSSSYPAPTGGEDKARTLLDVGVALAPRNLPITITAECKNCTMVNYGTADLLGLDYFNTPGTWDVRLNYKF